MTPTDDSAQHPQRVEPRVLGGWEGQVRIHDDFDDLPVEVAAAFAGDERPPM